jgi:hypothetical protein
VEIRDAAWTIEQAARSGCTAADLEHLISAVAPLDLDALFRADDERAHRLWESWNGTASGAREMVRGRELRAADAGRERVQRQAEAVVAKRHPRDVDLGPYLSGEYVPTATSVGAARTDGRLMLYAGRWHTLGGPTETGKSWIAAWHAAAELLAGRRVVYAHWEEADPRPTLYRLGKLGVPVEVVAARLSWPDCGEGWRGGEWAVYIAGLPEAPSLVIHDGIAAACGAHGWDVTQPVGPDNYRRQLVLPSTTAGATVLSLGHPVKNLTRQFERHIFGAEQWLSYLDGAAFRVLPNYGEPIEPGVRGSVPVYVVKDRHSGVRQGLAPHPKESSWRQLGTFVLDASTDDYVAELRAPGEGNGTDPYSALSPADELAAQIEKVLAEAGGGYGSTRDLEAQLAAAGVRYAKGDLGAALARLEARGAITRPAYAPGRARPGRLSVPRADQETEQTDQQDGGESECPAL